MILNFIPIKLATLSKLFAAADVLKASYDLTSFGFFQRGTVQEFINLTAKILAERTQIGERQSVREKEYICHVFVRSDSLAGVCLSDEEYPQRVAHTMLTKILEDFTNQVLDSCEYPLI